MCMYIYTTTLRPRSQILVFGLTGRARSSLLAAPGGGFSRQNLRIKYILYIGTHLWITVPANLLYTINQIYFCEKK